MKLHTIVLTLETAFKYAEEALRMSQALHSNIYTGKCYLQLSMVQELRNNNSMIEVNARKAIEVLAKTNQINDLGEAWVMVWSAKMRTNAPIKERLIPIFKAATLFEKSGNKKEAVTVTEKSANCIFQSQIFITPQIR